MKRKILDIPFLKTLIWIAFPIFLLLPVSSFSGPLKPRENRWIATSPQVTELLYQLGWAENLVGAPFGSRHPEASKKLSSIGNFLSPNLEKIIRLRPTKIWADISEQKIYSVLEKKGIETVFLDLRTVDKVFESAEKIGSQTNLLQEAKRNWQKRSKTDPFTFLILAWPDPPLVFGEDTFLFDLISRKGGRGVLPTNWRKGFFSVSAEWLISQNPDRVFYLSHNQWANQTNKQYEKACHFWWPEGQKKCFPLSSDHFARASLTPFFHWEEISFP